MFLDRLTSRIFAIAAAISKQTLYFQESLKQYFIFIASEFSS